MSSNPSSSASSLGHSSRNSDDIDGLEASLQSLHKIVASVTHAQLRTHTAPDERQLLDNIEGQLTALYDNSRVALRYRRNQLSKINSLPDEVLTIILSHAKNDKIPWEMLQYLPVTWICRRWRILAMDSPKLWNLIDLAYPSGNGVHDEILRRSKSTKLSVGQLGRRFGPRAFWRPSMMGWIDNGYVPEAEVDTHYGLFKHFIVPIIQRVENLELKLLPSHWIDAFTLLQDADLSIARCHFHELHDWSTSTSQTEERLHDPRTAVFLAKIFNPQVLRMLDIRFQRLPLALISTFPPVDRLQALVLTREDPSTATDSLTLQGLLLILESCRLELKILKLFALPRSISPPGTMRASPHARITMARLGTMVLDSPSDTIVVQCLSTPALKTLYIDARHCVSQVSEISHCMDFSTLPYMKIERKYIVGSREVRQDGLVPEEVLKIKNYDVSHLLIGSIGSNLSAWAGHLLSLTMVGSVINFDLPQLILGHAHVLRSLDIDESLENVLTVLTDVAICPRLESLTYRSTSRTGSPGKQLVSLVRSRRNEGAALKRLILFARQPVAKTNLEKLEKWVDYRCYIDTSDMD